MALSGFGAFGSRLAPAPTMPSTEAERTFDRSFEHFAQMVAAGAV